MIDQQRRCIDSIAFALEARDVCWRHLCRIALVKHIERIQRRVTREDARDVSVHRGDAVLIRHSGRCGRGDLRCICKLRRFLHHTSRSC